MAYTETEIAKIMEELDISSYSVRTTLCDNQELDTELMITFKYMYQDIPDSLYKMHHVPEISIRECSGPVKTKLERLERLVFGEEVLGV
jgi:hypothetical protein